MGQTSITEQSESYSAVTRDILVTVEPAFVEERSDLVTGVYVFMYKVTIENNGNQAAKLLNRHWKVFSANAQYADVKGEGVVGEQPLLEPASVFQYTSWTVIQDQLGYMEGSYTFRAESGEFFDVKIPRFDLIYIGDSAVH